MKETLEIANGVYYVGVKDYNRRVFDALIPLPRGTSYNSYLIKAKEPVLIDTVNADFKEEWAEKVDVLAGISEIKYLVMNHAEPDHAGLIPFFMKENKKAKLITSLRGKKMAQEFYQVPEERIIAVSDGEEISLGDRKIRFIEAPMLHWPETMFTYLEDEGALFSCDFFGFHTAGGFYDDEFPDLEFQARRYYGEIMMPFAVMGKKALEKIDSLGIKLICPSHGPIHRSPQKIIKLHKTWTAKNTKEKVIIIYASMWQHTEKMVEKAEGVLLSKGIEYARYNILGADIGDICADLVDSRAIIFAAPTVLGSMHPLGIYAASLVKLLKPPAKYALLFSSYGWAEAALKEMKQNFSSLGIEILGEKTVLGAVKEKDLEEVNSLTGKLIEKIKQN